VGNNKAFPATARSTQRKGSRFRYGNAFFVDIAEKHFVALSFRRSKRSGTTTAQGFIKLNIRTSWDL